jgi:hypothetical protein
MRDELDRNGPVDQSAKFVIGGAFSDRVRLNFTALAICYFCTGTSTGPRQLRVADDGDDRSRPRTETGMLTGSQSGIGQTQ